jgi:hypothetical protein
MITLPEPARMPAETFTGSNLAGDDERIFAMQLTPQGEQAMAALERATAEISRVLAETYKPLGYQPTPAQWHEHVTLMAAARKCQARADELALQWRAEFDNARRFFRDAELALQERIEGDPPAPAGEDRVVELRDLPAALAEGNGHASADNAAAGADVGTAPQVASNAAGGEERSPAANGEHSVPFDLQEKYDSIEQVPWHPDDEAVTQLVLERSVARVKIYASSPGQQHPKRPEIDDPYRLADGTYWAVIGARNFNKEGRACVAYFFNQVINLEEQPSGKRYRNFDELPLSETAAPENVPMQGLIVTGTSGDEWMLEPAWRFQVHVLGEALPADGGDDDQEGCDPAAGKLDALSASVAAGDRLDPASDEYRIPDKPKGQSLSWFQWRHLVSSALGTEARKRKDCPQLPGIDELKPVGLLLDLYQDGLKPAAAAMEYLDALGDGERTSLAPAERGTSGLIDWKDWSDQRRNTATRLGPQSKPLLADPQVNDSGVFTEGVQRYTIGAAGKDNDLEILVAQSKVDGLYRAASSVDVGSHGSSGPVSVRNTGFETLQYAVRTEAQAMLRTLERGEKNEHVQAQKNRYKQAIAAVKRFLETSPHAQVRSDAAQPAAAAPAAKSEDRSTAPAAAGDTPCDRCGKMIDVKPIQQRVAGTASRYEEKVDHWCYACRLSQNGSYRAAKGQGAKPAAAKAHAPAKPAGGAKLRGENGYELGLVPMKLFASYYKDALMEFQYAPLKVKPFELQGEKYITIDGEREDEGVATIVPLYTEDEFAGRFGSKYARTYFQPLGARDGFAGVRVAVGKQVMVCAPKGEQRRICFADDGGSAAVKKGGKKR